MTRCRHRKPKNRAGLCRRCARVQLDAADPRRIADRYARRLRLYRERLRAARARHDDRARWPARDRRLRRRYGITLRRCRAMYRAGRRRCWICRRALAAFYVDHDHRTERVRGVLCFRCNRGLALFRDDPAALAVAARYVAETFDARRARQSLSRVVARLHAGITAREEVA